MVATPSRPTIAPRILVMAILGLGGCILDDRPSRRSAERAQAAIHRGMALDEVVSVTEPMVEPEVWSLKADGCAPSGQSWGIGHARSGAGYEITPFKADGSVAGPARATASRELLAAALAEDRLRSCRDIEVGLGQWGVSFRVDASGRVASAPRLHFTD